MGDIERVQRIAPAVPIDLGRVHKPDQTGDGKHHQHPQPEADIIELTAEVEEEAIQTPRPASDDGHLDIAV